MSRVERDRIGATRGKLAVVGLLAAALVGVLAKNFHGASPEAVTEPTSAASETPAAAVPHAAAPTPNAAPASRQTAKPASPFGEFAEDAAVPAYSLEKLVSFDPLAAPAWMADTEQAADREQQQADDHSIEELQAAQNAIILVSGDQRVARIGSQDYRVGDLVGRYQITDISSAGIVLSEPAKDATEAK